MSVNTLGDRGRRGSAARKRHQCPHNAAEQLHLRAAVTSGDTQLRNDDKAVRDLYGEVFADIEERCPAELVPEDWTQNSELHKSNCQQSKQQRSQTPQLRRPRWEWS